MPFKKTDEGWQYDEKGDARIKSKRRGLFDRPLPKVQVLDEFGHPINADEAYWKKVIEDANRKE